MGNMETRVVLDTDVLVDLMGNVPEVVERIKILEKEVFLATTDINAFELYYGAYGASSPSRNLAAVKGTLSALTRLSTSDDSMEVAGQIAARLKSQGKILDASDLLIAAITMSRGFSLLTRNTKHFGRIKGLKLFDPG